jgi:uncharacterized YigZ family protein
METPQGRMAEGLEKFSFIAPRHDADAEFTVKRSRFIGSVRTVLSAEEAAEKIKDFPNIYPKANHHCWAYRVGTAQPLEHCSDAGEPAGTAGRPILGTIKRHELENTLIVVTRYFGGIKLGVRGLIEAYGEAAEMAAAAAGAVEMEFCAALEISCGYDYSKTLTTTLHKWGFTDERQKTDYGEDVNVKLGVPLAMKDEISPALEEMKARGFLKKLTWGREKLVREKQ